MSKENVKINKVEAPTLFIGVGGTGCNIVQRVAEMCRPGETKNVNFVYLDTNVNDLSNVAKSKSKTFYVQTSNTQTVGDYLAYDDDALKNWFPKNAVIYDKTVSEGAGQVRAISRLALNSTIKTGKIRPLYDAIDDLFRKDGRELKQALRIVIVSTASGGTGSGIALPLAMFVRDHVMNKYPNTSLIVRSMILLPETLDSVVDSSVERDSQRRNAYATIKEINAFMMKGSGFLDVESDLKRYGDLHIDFPIPGTDDKKSLGILPFDFCFLMDGQDAEDTTLVNLEQYKRQAAQALYEQNIGPMQKNAFSVEDNIIKEMSNPGNFGRNRFGAIGASVVRYPYERIVDYVAYNWAIDSIGGEGEASKWSRYDKAFEMKRNEARKNGVPQSEMPLRSDVYVEQLQNSSDNFSKDIRSRYLSDDETRVSEYVTSLVNEVQTAVNNNRAIQNAAFSVTELAREIDYKENEQKRGKAPQHLGLLQAYEMAVMKNTKKVAESVAESIFYNETKTVNAKAPYMLENLLKNVYNEICHPTAMRYMLYKVRSEFNTRLNDANDAVKRSADKIARYGEVDNPDSFDVKYTKDVERNLAALCRADKGDPTLSEKMAGYNQIYDQLNEHFPAYHKAITDYCKAVTELEVCRQGLEYVDALNKTLERFFGSFAEKVEELAKKKGDLVDELEFRKGDSVFNVCSSEELLDELSRSTKNQAEEGALLDSEANGDIFDAVKKNVAFEREISSMEVVEEDKRVDIFGDVLIGYFKKDVRRKCANLDLNIVEAIALETRLIARLKIREQSDSADKVFDKVTNEDSVRHIQEVIAMGQRLAAPSVQRMRNVESREISLCAYNKSLSDMRTFRVHDLMPKGNAVDSVSKYELRFFNALYNLTPDKLNKFAAPHVTETTKKTAGLYHNAYSTYGKDIGPDTTKGAKISAHIDKRWDNIAVMPALDLGYQEREMMRIHQAMIYALVYGAITREKLSHLTKDPKMVYKYFNSSERYVNLSVSNNTPCDEFYEIVDAMYLSPFIVSDVEVVKAKKDYKDRMHHSNYDQTQFCEKVNSFSISEAHERVEDGRTVTDHCVSSLFEIPVYYYASLPNNKRFSGEITAIVDAVVKTFEDELLHWEDKDDVKFKLCDILQQQYNLLMENYKKYDKLKAGYDNPKDNPILETILRKIQHVIETTPEPSDYVSMIEEMKKKLG